MQNLPPVICLMGPTASGKTPLAVELVQAFPCEIVSVDSAMVYRGLDIGTAKPNADILKIAPHRLIDIVDPKEIYSAGQFRTDALQAIHAILACGRVPLLVGGTMLYFRVLAQGLSDLPAASPIVRAALQQKIAEKGLESLYAELQQVDPIAASRIHVHDQQRIQRALEIYQLTGKPLSFWQAMHTEPLQQFQLHFLALQPNDRALLHQKIAQRFDSMLDQGLIAEVEKLYARKDLTPDLPAIRSVGYRQTWDYLAGNITFSEMREKAITATRQLAKRQMTWLRSWSQLKTFESENKAVFKLISAQIKPIITQFKG